ncbi:nucleotidyltransferase domain-containing protein [Candidatus Woesearchaeota archaeon]|nr:nucleotidyltransferase domain-containing protein [Candidatus Woesearchaeota archaeon]
MDKKKSKLINELKKFKRQNNIEKMYLFGSRVSGRTHKWSDVDLIVVSKIFRGKNITNRSSDLYMKWDLNYPVDFLCYAPEEFNKLKKQITIVREAIINGVEI